jgi:hypothetical protein
MLCTAQSEIVGDSASPSVPPTLIVSKPADESANKSGQRSLASRRRNPGPRPVYQEQGRSSSTEWEDVDESPPRRRRSSRRSTKGSERLSKQSASDASSQRSSRSDLSRYLPSLSRILEASESNVSSRPTTRGPDTRRRRDRTPTRRPRYSDDSNSVYRRPVRHRNSGVQRRGDSLLNINPSLLSVLSSLTASTDRSSGSNSTITQRSYNRRGSDSSSTPLGMPRRSNSSTVSATSSSVRSKPANVFDYMVASSVDEDHDDRSEMSSAPSSHYEPSLAGSSEAPDTPSSRSTFPSPTATRSHSVAELRRKYDPQYAGSEVSACSGSHSPSSSVRNMMKPPSVSDVAEDDEDESDLEPTAPSELSYDPRQRSSSRSSRASQRSHSRLSRQEEAMRQHMAHAEQQTTYPTLRRPGVWPTSISLGLVYAVHPLRLPHGYAAVSMALTTGYATSPLSKRPPRHGQTSRP